MSRLDYSDLPNTPSVNDDGAEVFVFPTSFPQRRLWLLDQLLPGGKAYNLTSAWRIEGALNLLAIEKSFSEILRRHEILRTTFKTVDGEPVQIISEAGVLHLPVIDLRALSASEREVRVRGIIDDEFRHSFDLERGPLLRLNLLKLDDQEHVLVKNIHHIITDLWSEDIFTKEWLSLYESFAQNKPVTLVELPIQYADFSEWQRETLQGGKLDEQFSWWKKKLGDGVPTLQLPRDFPRPAATANNPAASVNFKLSRATTAGLKMLGHRENVTSFMTLLAAFNILLYRYTNQEDIVVGTPITNRNRSELEPLIGFFLNMLVMRTRFDGNSNFVQAVGRVRDTALEAFAHQDLPFEVLVEKLLLGRNLERHPLFQVMFVLMRAGEKTLHSDGISIKPIDVEPASAQFDLVMSLLEKDDIIEGSFIYNTALFKKPTIERMVKHFQTLLDGIVADPGKPIADLPILDENELHQLLVDWNNTARPCSLIPVHELVAAQCERMPGKIAITAGDRNVTYGELYKRAEWLAARLQGLGVGPGKLVGICVERSPEMIAGLLGILLSGAAYVPLDPEFPKTRIEMMVEDSKPPVIITQRSTEGVLPASNATIIYLEDGKPCLETFRRANVTPDNLAYVLFTSGSTGRPKGVEIPHRALTNLLESMREQPGFTNEDTLLAVTTLSFDIAGLEIFLPLICGAKIVLASREMAVDVRQLAEVLDKNEITVMQATPATWRGLLTTMWRGSHKLKILCGGEAMPADLAELLLARCGSLWNVYGPTETTIWSTVEKVESIGTTVSIGHPIANTQIYILNGRQQPQAVGVFGELYIGGLGIAQGYLGYPELTAKKFIPDPFGRQEDRLYKTGDLARYLADGSIEFLGRTDHQVKIRGFRIELAEIESALGRYPDVTQCVVIAREDRPGDKRLVAYVVKRGNEEEADLRAFLKNKLPDYMMPSAFVFLGQLPLTPNGKVDRKALLAMDCGSSRQHEYVPPRTPLEQKLAAIWAHVLGVERVGMNDDFFELGGHSLMAVSLFTGIEQKLGRKLPLATLFQATTLEQLANVIQQEEWTPSWSPLVPMQPLGNKEPFFCIHGADGAVLFYNKLASLFAPDQPVYGLQAQGLDGGHIIHSSMEGMASLYIREIRSVQPKGPYFLGGYSFGGLLALEIARQLREQGERIAMIALLDANNPLMLPRRYTLRERMVLRMRAIANLSLKQKIAFVLNRGWGKLAVIVLLKKEALKILAYKFNSKHKEVIPVNYRILHVREANNAAADHYQPRVYDGILTLIRAENPNDGFEFDSKLGWGGLATDGIEIHDVPGEHETMFHEPHVYALAETLRNCIEKARLRFGL